MNWNANNRAVRAVVVAVLALSCMAGQAATRVDLVVRAADFESTATANVLYTLTPVAPLRRTDGTNLVTAVAKSKRSDANGVVVFTNTIWGAYTLDIPGNAATSWALWITTNYSGSVSAATFVTNSTAMPPNPTANYYTMSQIDALLQQPILIYTNGAAVTNLLAYGLSRYLPGMSLFDREGTASWWQWTPDALYGYYGATDQTIILETSGDARFAGDAFARSFFGTATTVSQVPLTSKGMAGQTGNLFEAKDSTDRVMARVTPAGNLLASNVWDRSNARYWGAVGDTNTDDTLAIQNWVNGSDTLFLPPGTFILNDTITITGPKTIVGQGGTLRLSGRDVWGTNSALFSTNGITSMLVVTGANVTISGDLTLDGNTANNWTDGGGGTRLYYGSPAPQVVLLRMCCSNGIVDGITIKNSPFDNAEVWVGTDIAFRNVTFIGGQGDTLPMFWSTNVTVSGCSVYQPNTLTFHPYSGCDNVDIVNNRVNVDWAIFPTNTSGLYQTSPLVWTQSVGGIRVGHSGDYLPVRRVMVGGNTLRGTAGISSHRTASEVQIQNNILDDTVSAGISVIGDATNAATVTVSGNSVTMRDGPALYAADYVRGTFVGNTLVGVTNVSYPVGVFSNTLVGIDSVTSARFQGNTFSTKDGASSANVAVGMRQADPTVVVFGANVFKGYLTQQANYSGGTSIPFQVNASQLGPLGVQMRVGGPGYDLTTGIDDTGSYLYNDGTFRNFSIGAGSSRTQLVMMADGKVNINSTNTTAAQLYVAGDVLVSGTLTALGGGGGVATNVYQSAAGTGIAIVTNGLLYTISATGTGSQTPLVGDVNMAGYGMTNGGTLSVSNLNLSSDLTLSGTLNVSNMTIGSITGDALSISTTSVSNGVVYLQRSSAPTAADIGGAVGTTTNYMILNLNGALMKYWSDGTTLWSQEIGTH